MKKWWKRICCGQSGQALPIVLALLVFGSLVTVPSLNYAATSLKSSDATEAKTKGLYAAEAGIEDALWKLVNDKPASFPYSYELTGINGMTVGVTIDEVTVVFGEMIGGSGEHSDWLIITKEITWSAGVYYYTMNLFNNGSGNMKIEQILIDFPAGISFVEDSTGGDITSLDPDVNGYPGSGITVIWTLPSPTTISAGSSKDHSFELSGAEGINGIEGHGFVRATRDDVGTVWDSDSLPYTITAQASNDSGQKSSIRAGVWQGTSLLDISCWQINP
ncbi:MAG: pilus assembly PilX N-terminal domain-containing protein [Dehalococcoidales bacterium]|nr:pilus assembly PilX N-terminal domain-containing protein [Dehalococcoidales bacterium]